MRSMHYREATLDDLPAICELGDDVNAMHHQAEPHVFAPGGDPQRHRDHWATTVGQESATTFLAISEDQAIGFVTVTVANDVHSLLKPLRYGRVGTVGVGSGHRGLGIGSELMALAEKWVKVRGCTELRLTVGAFNERAAKLYADRGYQVRAKQLVRSLGDAN